MNIILSRKDYREDGIFGFILTSSYKYLFTTCEHSYNQLPKLPEGVYQCKRGTGSGRGVDENGNSIEGFHRLHDGVWFDTFEVMGVPNHTGILFHVGNYNEDSEGCILVGTGFGNRGNGGKMITASKQAFKEFMGLQHGCDEFTLTVT